MDRRYEAGGLAALADRSPGRLPFPTRPRAFYVGNAFKAELVDVFVDGTTIQGLEQEPPDQDGR